MKKNFAYTTNYPFGGFNECTRSYYPNDCKQNANEENDDRFGGFILPFITGAVASAPFWFIAGNNKQNNNYYQQQPYYQNQSYPMYYPYQSGNTNYPSYFPYPPYR